MNRERSAEIPTVRTAEFLLLFATDLHDVGDIIGRDAFSDQIVDDRSFIHDGLFFLRKERTIGFESFSAEEEKRTRLRLSISSFTFFTKAGSMTGTMR